MRPEEYLGLQWKDVGFNEGTITILRAMLFNRKGGGWYFKEPKSAQSGRTIPIPAHLVGQLKRHRTKQLKERLKAGDKYQNYDLVFATSSGTPILIRNLDRRRFKPLLEKAKLPDIRLCDLRHSCATLLFAAGENAKVVSERLGHSSTAFTQDTYVHVLRSMQTAATSRLEGILGNVDLLRIHWSLRPAGLRVVLNRRDFGGAFMSALVDIGTLITQTPGIHGGRPQIAGTGVTVRRIVMWYKLGSTPEEIVQEIDHLSLAQVYGALAYYHVNREAIDADLDAEEAEAEQIEREHYLSRQTT